MKKINWRGLLFAVLILVLTLGLSYLGLNQVSTDKDEPDTMRMSIALVNEDEGARFKSDELAFGDEFIKSIDRDSEHDWYVVSRGVAENGYERNDYNMMIIIPNDFSEKAISIESDSPEPVVLNYKINATGHENIKAEAEKTASKILNDFNRRIIDVYFASVIGNLQEAQDNISAIVEKEATYTNAYNDSIHSPLSNYTSQFEAIQDNTTRSKDSFHSLEEILETFENELNEDVEINKSYLSNISEIAQLKEQNSSILLSYAEQFKEFIEGINSGDVLNQKEELKRNNQLIYDEFKQREEEISMASNRGNIVSYADVIKRNLSPVKRDVGNLLKYLENPLNGDEEGKDIKQKHETLFTNIKKRVDNRLPSAFEGGFAELNEYFSDFDEELQEYHIQSQIDRLPSLDLADIEHLHADTQIELTNVILVTEKYLEENNYNKSDNENIVMLAPLINDIKEKLIEGVTISEEVDLSEGTKSNSVFSLTGPEGYDINELRIKYSNGNETVENYQSGDLIDLTPINQGRFTVELDITLAEIENGQEIDVFKPVGWSWKLEQENITGEDIATDFSAITSNNHSDKTETNNNKNTEVLLDESDNVIKTADVDSENSTDDKPNNLDKEETVVDEEEQEEQVDQEEEENQNNGENDQNPDPEIPKVEIINNKIYHTVMSTIDKQLDGKDITETLINTVVDTVSEYQRMLSLYEIYYGIDMESGELAEHIEGLEEDEGLADLPTVKEKPLHYIFNKDLSDLLKDIFVKDIAKAIMKEIEIPLNDLRRDVSEHEKIVQGIDENSTLLVERITRTSEATEKMNTDLAEILANIEAWRDRSMDLFNEQNEVLANESEEQSAVMALDGDFQPLLMSSESLANQAQGNLSSAEIVYQTFDAIDDQAITIQQSGINLVAEAEDLSIKLTDKLIDDQEFADNFTDVLANSRVGDRQNESLYDFLSNPVKTENDGTIVAGDTFTPYFLVLILSIVSLFTAYVISTHNQRTIDEDPFQEEKTLIGKNMPLTMIVACIGLVEGIVIGILSGYLLSISQAHIVIWTIMITLTTVTMLFIATYLLRQLKMVGMFILLVVLSIYLFFTEALGFGFDKVSFVKNLRMFSPLQYVETLLDITAKSLTNNESLILTFFTLIIVLLVSFVANLFVLSRASNEEGVDDEEELVEAN